MQKLTIGILFTLVPSYGTSLTARNEASCPLFSGNRVYRESEDVGSFGMRKWEKWPWPNLGYCLEFCRTQGKFN
jgi:hypothetical protein